MKGKEIDKLLSRFLDAVKLSSLHVFGLAAILVCLPVARADVAILLEEPYSHDAELAGTGHAAVYLTRICASSPTSLRRCLPGEEGAVISRYHDVGVNDWFAVPLTAYLFAVEKPQDIPLFADARIVAALRDHYRRRHLESVAPDPKDGETPGGNWYELVGSAYDRTLYAFQLETSEEQDDAFIAEFNSRSNRAAYKLVTRNCADFVREVANFYYPHAIGRGWIADLAVETPKHAAKSFVNYAHKHPDLQFSALVIPQVPGSIKRSKPIHGLADSIFKAKKYEVPLLVLSPFAGAGVALAYYTGGRFDPAHNAQLLDPMGDIGKPVTSAERKSYLLGVNELVSASAPSSAAAPTWREFTARAELTVDREGRPLLRTSSASGTIQVGISRGNLAQSGVAADLAREMLIARLRQELRGGGAPKTSNELARSDMQLLQKVSSRTQSASSAPYSDAGGIR